MRLSAWIKKKNSVTRIQISYVTREKKKKLPLYKYECFDFSSTEVKIMKAIFVIAVIFACSVCEVTSLNCYECSQSLENVPTCASPKKVRCVDESKFCGKVENDGFTSLFLNPPGGYISKGCFEEEWCTESGYYWFWGVWVTCCQGDYCNV